MKSTKPETLFDAPAMKGQDIKSGVGPGSLVHEILTATNKED